MLGVIGRNVQTIGLGYGTKNEMNKMFLKGGNLCFFVSYFLLVLLFLDS